MHVNEVLPVSARGAHIVEKSAYLAFREDSKGKLKSETDLLEPTRMVRYRPRYAAQGCSRRSASRKSEFGSAPGSTAATSPKAVSISTSRRRAPYSAEMVGVRL